MKQLSIFLKNKPGELTKLTDCMIESSAKIMSMCITDTNENGILRMVIEEPEKLMKLFIEKDFNCYLSKVVVVKINTPTDLNKILKLFSDNDLNVEYLYTYKEDYYVIKIENIKKAEDILKEKKFIVLEEN